MKSRELEDVRHRAKGQSAIEYLTTYGWMLLVVAVVGGAFYALTQGQCTSSVSGQLDNSLTVTDFGVNTQGNLDVMFRNTYNEPITVHTVNISQESASRIDNPGMFLSVSERSSVELEGVRGVNGCNTIDLTVKYSAGNLENLTTTGKLSAPYTVAQNPLPMAPTGGSAEL